MIPGILSFVEKRFALPQNELTFVLFSGGVNRSREAFRNVSLIYHHTTPVCVARWYNEEDGRLTSERDVLVDLERYQAPTPRCLELVTIGNKTILFEELLDGPDLNSLVAKKLLSKETAVTEALEVFEELFLKTKEASEISQLEEELRLLFALGIKHNLFSELPSELIPQIQNSILSHFRNAPIVTSMVHFDLTLKNIIATKNHPRCFDCEFTSRSHFYFVDWLRLWVHSPSLKGEQFVHYVMPKSISEIVSEEEVFRSFLVLYDLISFKTQLRVFPKYLLSTLQVSAQRNISSRLDRTQDAALLFATETSEEDLSTAEHLDSFEAKYYHALKVVEETTKKYDAVQLALSKRNAKYATYHALAEEFHATKSKLEEAYRVLSAQNEQLKMRLLATENLLGEQAKANEKHVADLHALIEHKEGSLREILHSSSFRLGHKITSSIKKIPGSDRLIGVVKQ